jgi:hypothetical protein
MAPVSNDTRFAKPDRGGRDVPVPVPARNVRQNCRVGANRRSARRIEHAAAYITQREAEAIIPLRDRRSYVWHIAVGGIADKPRTDLVVALAVFAARRPAVPGRARCICAPSCDRVPAGGQSPRLTALADANPVSSRAPPVGSPPRPSRRSGEIIGSSAISTPLEFPERGPGGPASHLGKIQTALLGRITPPVTQMRHPVRCH